MRINYLQLEKVYEIDSRYLISYTNTLLWDGKYINTWKYTTDGDLVERTNECIYHNLFYFSLDLFYYHVY